ncbi:7062_t:CDS:2 [Paraglomus occultum]|uniref:7062_t:CDS:1 n=1 Tax=Paraglomus occultum TaxID=144539 RepID=A0A9N9G3D8_9GLOM|nr:7062_t:CDS:2 [Paraglomus occultum]
MASVKDAGNKYGDFRSAIITQHWNDPPQKVRMDLYITITTRTVKVGGIGLFHKEEDGSGSIDSQEIVTLLNSLLDICKKASTHAERRVIADTEKRITFLFEKLEKQELPDPVLGKVGKVCEHLDNKDFQNALSMHNNLMTTHFDKEGKWLLGVKRLIDLYQKQSTALIVARYDIAGVHMKNSKLLLPGIKKGYYQTAAIILDLDLFVVIQNRSHLNNK